MIAVGTHLLSGQPRASFLRVRNAISAAFSWASFCAPPALPIGNHVSKAIPPMLSSVFLMSEKLAVHNPQAVCGDSLLRRVYERLHLHVAQYSQLFGFGSRDESLGDCGSVFVFQMRSKRAFAPSLMHCIMWLNQESLEISALHVVLVIETETCEVRE